MDVIKTSTTEEQSEIVYQIKEQAEQLLENAESMRDDIDEYRFNEIDATLEHKSRSLQHGFEEFDKICTALSAFKKIIEGQWTYLSEILEAL